MLYQRVCFAMVLALLIGGAASRVAGAERPPNFVIVFIDDMGYADTGPFGAKGYATPNLDRLAKEGDLRFDWKPGVPLQVEAK